MTPATWTDVACCGITAVVFGIALCLAGRRRRQNDTTPAN